MKYSFHQLRRTVQVLVVILLLVVPVLNHVCRFHGLYGNLLSFNFFGLPFNDPAAAVQVSALTQTVPFRMLAGAGIVLLLAAIMGPIFCGWLCPFGFISELIHKNKHLSHDKKKSRLAFTPHKLAFLGKISLFLIGLVLAFIFQEPLLNYLSMPGWVSRFFQHLIAYKEFLFGGLFVLFILAFELVSKKRFWCRYICPQSFLLCVAGMILPQRLQVKFIRTSCTCHASDRLCQKVCSLNLNPRKPTAWQKFHCVNCGDCIDACNKRGKALCFSFGQQNKKS